MSVWVGFSINTHTSGKNAGEKKDSEAGIAPMKSLSAKCDHAVRQRGGVFTATPMQQKLCRGTPKRGSTPLEDAAVVAFMSAGGNSME